MTDDDALIARIRALSDVAYWANVEWIIPGDATQAIGKLAVEAADRIAALTAQVSSMGKDGDQMAADFLRERARAAKAEAERDALRKIAIELRSNVCCEHLHHKKSEQHSGTDCPVEKRIDAAIRAGEKP